MPAGRGELQSRRRAARARRRRRRAGLALLAVGGAVALIVALTSGGERTAETSEDESPASAPAAPPAAAQSPTAERLSAAELAGQRLIAGYDGIEPPRGLRRMVRGGELAGVILFAENVTGPARTWRAIRSLQRIRRPRGLREPLAIMIDQEGGQVKRIAGPPSASAERMGERGRGFARRQGRATARLLRAHGVNVDLAPVLDVGRRGAAIAREERSFGRRSDRVGGVGVGGFARGLREGGVAATAKHFPGLGAAAVNTDDAAQRIKLSKRRLRRVDQPPFESFSRAEGELVMLGLATYTAFSDRPAALSRSIATGELRGRLGFAGVSISDSLDAAAARSFGPLGRVTTEAARAGTDLLLYGDWRTARRSLVTLRRGLRSGTLDRGGFERSVARVLELRRELAG